MYFWLFRGKTVFCCCFISPGFHPILVSKKFRVFEKNIFDIFLREKILKNFPQTFSKKRNLEAKMPDFKAIYSTHKQKTKKPRFRPRLYPDFVLSLLSRHPDLGHCPKTEATSLKTVCSGSKMMDAVFRHNSSPIEIRFVDFTGLLIIFWSPQLPH